LTLRTLCLIIGNSTVSLHNKNASLNPTANHDSKVKNSALNLPQGNDVKDDFCFSDSPKEHDGFSDPVENIKLKDDFLGTVKERLSGNSN
jgi:hypothetical protein